mmetsp:Transcript_22118/g.33429  ORF Transcript_22118/g.33429 Transcript_22118/m.33429 type:complete len:364 (-) Transcript_22118:1685-2776(-)
MMIRRENRSRKHFGQRETKSVRKKNYQQENLALEAKPGEFTLGSLKLKQESPKSQQPQSRRKRIKGRPFYIVGLILLFILALQLPVFSQISSGISLFGGFFSNDHASTKTHEKGLRMGKNVMLPKPGEFAPMQSSTRMILPLVKLRKAPTKEYHIFSVSSSTTERNKLAHLVLSNILMALFDEPDEHLGTLKWSVVGNEYLTRHRNEWVDSNTTIVSHAPDVNLIEIQREFRSRFRNLILVIMLSPKTEDGEVLECALTKNDEGTSKDSENKNSHSPVMTICFQPDEILYDFEHHADDAKLVIARVVEKLQSDLPYFAKIDFSMRHSEAVRRLSLMDEMQLQMRDQPKSNSETKYGIQGSMTR